MIHAGTDFDISTERDRERVEIDVEPQLSRCFRTDA